MKKIVSIFAVIAILFACIPTFSFSVAAAPVYNEENHTDYTSKMSVTYNGALYNFKNSISQNSKSGTNTYAFLTELSNDSDFYMSALVNTVTENVSWAGARFIIKKGANGKENGTSASDYVYLIFRSDGIFLIGISGGERVVASDMTVKRQLNKNYKITIYSKQDTASVWVDETLVFDNISLVYQKGGTAIDFTGMPSVTEIALASGDGSGRRPTNTTVSQIAIWGDKKVEITDEPQFDEQTHKDYSLNGQYEADKVLSVYDGQPITETGISGVKRYSFITAMTPQASYVFTATVNTSSKNTFWSGVRYVIRSGNNYIENGVSDGEVYVLFRDDGLYVIGISNGEKVIASDKTVKRVAGYTYRITVQTTPDTVSVWIDGKKKLENVGLVWTNGTDTVDFTDLPATPQLCFANGNGENQIQTVSTVNKIKIFNNPLTDNPSDPYAEPEYDSEKHTDYTSQMTVTRDGAVVDTKNSYSEKGSGTIDYVFDTLLTKASTYYYTATVSFPAICAEWSTPQLILREGRMPDGTNQSLQLVFRTNLMGIVNEKGSSIGSEFINTKTVGTVGRSYRLTVKSTPDTVSVWVDGKIVFRDLSLGEYSGLKSAPGIRFMLGAGETEGIVKDICIWNDASNENPTDVYDPTDEPEYNELTDVNFSETMSVSRQDENYTSDCYSETGENGDIVYSFKTGLTNNSTYYMTYYIDYESMAGSWTTPHILLRSGVAPNGEYEEIYLSFRTNGCVVVNKKGSGLTELVDYDIKAQEGKTYKLTVKCSPDNISVWLNKKLIFYEVSLMEYAGLYSTPGIKFRLGNADTPGISSSKIYDLIIWNNGTDENPPNIYKPTDEPVYNPKTDTDYTVKMTATDKKGNISQGKKNYRVKSSTDLSYSFKTNVARNAIYNFTADICLNSLAEEWASPQFVLRSGIGSDGKAISVGVVVRTNCVAVVNQDKVSINGLINYDIKATVGKTHKLTVRCESDKISVWFDGRLVIYNGNLGEYSGLKANPGLYFQCGSSVTTGVTDISVSNIIVWNNASENISAAEHVLFEDMIAEFPTEGELRLTHADLILKTNAFYNNMSADQKALLSENSIKTLNTYVERINRWLLVGKAPKIQAGQKNFAESASVLLDGRPYLQYSSNLIKQTDPKKFYKYVFETDLSTYDSYYYSGTVKCTSAEEEWQRPRIVFRGDGSHKLSVAFLRKGIYIMDNDSKSLYRETAFETKVGEDYDFVIHSTPTSFSLWVNGVLIFGNEPLNGEYRNLPVYLGITFAQAAGEEKNICIWSANDSSEQLVQTIGGNGIKQYYLPVSVKGNTVVAESITKVSWQETGCQSIHHLISSLVNDDIYSVSGKLSNLKFSENGAFEIIFRGSNSGENIRVCFTAEKISVIESSGNVICSDDTVNLADNSNDLIISSSKEKFSLYLSGKCIFSDVAINGDFNELVPALCFKGATGDFLDMELSLVTEKQQQKPIKADAAKSLATVTVIISGVLLAILVGVIFIVVRRKHG